MLRYFVAVLLGSGLLLAQAPKPNQCRIVWNTRTPANPPTAVLTWNGGPPKISALSLRTGDVQLGVVAFVPSGNSVIVDLDSTKPPQVGSKEATADITFEGESSAVDITCPLYTPEQW